MSFAQKDRRRDLMLAFAAFLVALVLWQMQGVYFLTQPFRLFVTMIHELGHGLAAVLTGGEFIRFEVTKRGAGLAYTSGGWRFAIIQAGYLGTAIFGACLLILTHTIKRPGRVAIGVGVFIGILTLAYSGISAGNLSMWEIMVAGSVLAGGVYLFFVREMEAGEHYIGLLVGLGAAFLFVIFAGSDNVLTILIGLISAGLLVVIGWRANRDVVVVTLTFLAFLTGLQAITDSWVLFKIVSQSTALMPSNDAGSMAREVGGTAWLWALVWIAMDIVIFGSAVYWVLIRPARRKA
ncbi:MAG: M50 family metallopeptidase [Anaerolineae bacterium]|nr:M50 family metallopeptidase [Anaerolineae bacterium]